jgi:hypothetical protein
MQRMALALAQLALEDGPLRLPPSLVPHILVALDSCGSVPAPRIPCGPIRMEGGHCRGQLRAGARVEDARTIPYGHHSHGDQFGDRTWRQHGLLAEILFLNHRYKIV